MEVSDIYYERVNSSLNHIIIVQTFKYLLRRITATIEISKLIKPKLL